MPKWLDWFLGRIFTLEDAPLIDKLIAQGIVTLAFVLFAYGIHTLLYNSAVGGPGNILLGLILVAMLFKFLDASYTIWNP